MFDKAPTRALVIGMMAAGMLSGCSSFGNLQKHHQTERILQQKEESVGIVFPIRLDFDEADNMTTLSVQKEITETLEIDDQVTVVGFELGQILCETLDGAEDASVLEFAISPTEVSHDHKIIASGQALKTLKAAKVSYKVFSGEAFSDGASRKVWMGKDTDEDADGTYRTVSLSWTTECNVETFLQTVTTHGTNGSLSVVKSIPCGAGSSVDICIVEIDLDLKESGEPLIPLGTFEENTRRHLGVQKLREEKKGPAEIAGDRRNLQSSMPKVDLLILYNQTSLKELGDISPSQLETMLAAEVEEGNDVLLNSEIDLEFVLVHVAEWTHELASNEGADVLATLVDDMDVADLRSEYEVDLVVLITPLSGICGIGYIYTGSTVSGFSTTAPICLSGRSMIQEIGHNFGCYPDRENSATQHDYAHGLRYCTEDPMIHTMMAHGCGGLDIQYFSNPDVMYSGLPTGIANDADCVRRIRETMVTVSEYSDIIMCNDNGGIVDSMGNGWCNSENNNEVCMWDKGDCCESCCSHLFCGATDYDCQDPNAHICDITPAPFDGPVSDTPAPTPGATSNGTSPGQTPPPGMTSASARMEPTLLMEGLLLYLTFFFHLCVLIQF